MLIPKDLLEKLRFAKQENDSEAVRNISREIKNHIADNYPQPKIIYSYIDLALKCNENNNNQILVSSEEYENIQQAISRLFRVKGIRLDGSIETRGRGRGRHLKEK